MTALDHPRKSILSYLDPESRAENRLKTLQSFQLQARRQLALNLALLNTDGTLSQQLAVIVEPLVKVSEIPQATFIAIAQKMQAGEVVNLQDYI